MRSSGRGFAPEVRMSLQPLDRIQHPEIRDALDLRSWRVMAGDGTSLGVVAEVIVDVHDRRPVYLQVVPDPQSHDAPAECWVRVPYRHAAVDEDTRAIVLNDAALLGLGTAVIHRIVEPTR